MKPGDRVIWLYSPGRSFLTGWRLQEIPGVIVGICRCRIRIRVWHGGKEKLVNVDPENVICEEQASDSPNTISPASQSRESVAPRTVDAPIMIDGDRKCSGTLFLLNRN